MESLAHSLRLASDSLTEETWSKGRYFDTNGLTICMCAHGAIQAVVNPQVRKVLFKVGDAPDTAVYLDRILARAADSSLTPVTVAEHADLAFNAQLRADAAHVASTAAITAAKDADSYAALADVAVLAADANDTAVGAAIDEALAASFARGRSDESGILLLWNQRPDRVREEFVTPSGSYGSTESSYLLGLFGLTAEFNDAKETTLAMVKDRYAQAISFAERYSL